MARGARIVVGLTWAACKWPVGNDMVVVATLAPWPYLITYYYLPLCMLIAIVVAPYAMWVRPLV